MKLNPPNAHRSQIKICEKRQTRNVQFRFMPNAFRILKPIQKSSKCVWVFRNTGANAFAKNQMRLAYEDKRDLYCMCVCISSIRSLYIWPYMLCCQYPQVCENFCTFIGECKIWFQCKFICPKFLFLIELVLVYLEASQYKGHSYGTKIN